ncbi:MAG: hypothetical protein KAJ75_07880 [Alphaproteobacteria bacterium]|nr:hypothetical protein [Alphaproteobacteria bacterium]
MKNPQEKTILSIIVSNLAKHNLLSHGYRLKADLEKRSENNCMLAVGAVLSNMFRKKPQLYFDYMIKAGLTSEVYNFTDNLTTRAVHRNNFTERFKGYMDYTGLSQADTALTISRFSSIYFRDKVKPTSSAIRRTTYSKPAPSIFRGTAVLYRNNPTDDTSLLINDCINDKAKSHAYLAAFPMFLSINEKGRREPLYSIWSLLAVIGELIREARSDKNDDEAIQKLMIKAKVLAQTRDYPTPTATDYRSSDFEEDDEEDTGETNNKNQPESSDETDKQTYKFFETFLEWAKKDDNNRNVPIYVMGRIYSRLYYTLTSIDADAKSKNKFLGEIFHRFIIAFLNAVLVEEALNKQDIEEVQLNNPVTSDNIFINNLKKTEKTAFPFFDWIVSCPVWLLYLNSNSDVFKKISGKEEGNKEGLYTLLNKVKIKSSKEKKEEKKKEKKKRRRPLYKNDAKLLKEFVQNMNDGKRDIIKLTTMIKKKCRELFNDEYNNKPSPTALKKCEQIVKDVLNKE